MAIKLIAIDLDDTLLDNRQQLSPRTLTVLKQAMRKGVAVTIATGRMFQSALPFATELGIELPLITYNGALIRQGDTLPVDGVALGAAHLDTAALTGESLPRALAPGETAMSVAAKRKASQVVSAMVSAA